jgi:hypothetical protein
VEPTTLWEVAAAISTAVAVRHEDGESLQQQAYAAHGAPLVAMLMLGQNHGPMHVQIWADL